MKLSAAIYVTLAVLGLAAAVLVPFVIDRSGSPALPFWRVVASPGPLSSAHAFLSTQCESCHTPNKGIAASSCITCHASEPLLLARQSTAFHATIQECRGCHIEHVGSDIRPVRVDHSVLTNVGVRAALTGAIPGQPITPSAVLIKRFLASVTASAPLTDGQALDCVSCHSFRDKHLGYFGQQCADCHVATTWKITGYLHPSPKSQECAQCHRPPPSHYMMHFVMMDQMFAGQPGARVDQCFACHETDAFNNIRGKGWFKMH